MGWCIFTGMVVLIGAASFFLCRWAARNKNLIQ